MVFYKQREFKIFIDRPGLNKWVALSFNGDPLSIPSKKYDRWVPNYHW